MDRFISQLAEQLKADLPGREAQYKMAHGSRQHYHGPPPDVRKAGVLALFYPKKQDWHLAFIERVSNRNDRHSGQISFPGGRMESQDKTLADTALREAQEEIGVPAPSIELLGALTDLYIPVSNYQVFPYVGVTYQTPVFRPQASEVQQVLEPPFKLFLDPARVSYMDMPIANNLVLRRVPYYDIFGKVIWGATAMMLSELVTVVDRMNQ